MIDVAPELETRVEEALLLVFREAFPKMPVQSFSDPGERSGKCIGIKAESNGEELPGANIFAVSIEIESRNLEYQERQLLFDMVGNTYNATETLANVASRKFTIPRGQAVEMVGQPRTVENEKDRIITFQLLASIQPL